MKRSSRLVAARTSPRVRRKRGLREASQRPVGAGSPEAKPGLRAGGLAPGRRDPMRQVPLREPYGGTAPDQVGTPETVTGKKPRRKRRRK